jgi:hypothetical protein
VREHVDLPTVFALQDEWRLNPPVHHLVASYMQYKPDDPSQVVQVTDADDLAQALGNLPLRKVDALDTAAFDAEMNTKASHE